MNKETSFVVITALCAMVACGCTRNPPAAPITQLDFVSVERGTDAHVAMGVDGVVKIQLARDQNSDHHVPEEVFNTQAKPEEIAPLFSEALALLNVYKPAARTSGPQGDTVTLQFRQGSKVTLIPLSQRERYSKPIMGGLIRGIRVYSRLDLALAIFECDSAKAHERFGENDLAAGNLDVAEDALREWEQTLVELYPEDVPEPEVITHHFSIRGKSFDVNGLPSPRYAQSTLHLDDKTALELVHLAWDEYIKSFATISRKGNTITIGAGEDI
ncbi:MAG TPA: hypothetical protein VFE47_06545 [Tepidisphaeraceae bacterium]|nr:hypothetical protein [Tepidisphaeraceae bacterium]